MHNATLSFWFLPVFIVGWLAISFLLGVISGWHRLGKVYRRPEGARPTTVAQFQSIHMKLVGYRSCVTVGVDPAGLFLSVYLPFRFGHPPLLVPWDAIESLGPCNVFGFRYIRYRFGRTQIIDIWHRSRGARLMVEYLPTHGRMALRS